jgi:tetratricopeptide (TPR) repeat protein
VSNNNGVGNGMGAGGTNGRAPDELDGGVPPQRAGPPTGRPDLHDGVGNTRVEAEGELALARVALDADNPAQAATHLAAALGGDPTLPDAYDMLRALDTPPRRARDYFPLSDTTDLGAVAARSYLAARAGQFNDALNLLVMVAAAAPAKAWTAGGWLDLPGTAEQADPSDAAETLLYLALRLDEPVDAGLLPTLAPYLDFARRLIDAHPDRAEVLAPVSGLARRLGAVDDAVAWCELAERIAPSARTAIMLGYAYRALGRFDAMVASWESAAIRDPANVDVPVDLAEHLDQAGRSEAALRWLDRALTVDPSHPKALPLACEMRFRADGDVAHLIRLVDHWRAHSDDAYAGDRLAKACEGRLWLRIVPPATDDPTAPPATDNSLAPPATDDPIATHAAHSPIAARLAEDPTVPSESAVAVLHKVARGMWAHPVDAYRRATAFRATRADELLELMTHPPAPASEGWRQLARTDPHYWPSHARAWACLGLLHLRPDEPWATSERRRTLVNVATRSVGMPTGARDGALFALVVAAWLDPSARADVSRIIATRFAYVCRRLRRHQVANAVSMAVLVTITPQVAEPARRDSRLLLAAADEATDLAALSATARAMFGTAARRWLRRRLEQMRYRRQRRHIFQANR